MFQCLLLVSIAEVFLSFYNSLLTMRLREECDFVSPSSLVVVLFLFSRWIMPCNVEQFFGGVSPSSVKILSSFLVEYHHLVSGFCSHFCSSLI